MTDRPTFRERKPEESAAEYVALALRWYSLTPSDADLIAEAVTDLGLVDA